MKKIFFILFFFQMSFPAYWSVKNPIAFLEVSIRTGNPFLAAKRLSIDYPNRLVINAVRKSGGDVNKLFSRGKERLTWKDIKAAFDDDIPAKFYARSVVDIYGELLTGFGTLPGLKNLTGRIYKKLKSLWEDDTPSYKKIYGEKKSLLKRAWDKITSSIEKFKNTISGQEKPLSNPDQTLEIEETMWQLTVNEDVKKSLELSEKIEDFIKNPDINNLNKIVKKYKEIDTSNNSYVNRQINENKAKALKALKEKINEISNKSDFINTLQKSGIKEFTDMANEIKNQIGGGARQPVDGNRDGNSRDGDDGTRPEIDIA